MSMKFTCPSYCSYFLMVGGSQTPKTFCLIHLRVSIGDYLISYFPSAARCLLLTTNRIFYLLMYTAQFTKSQTPHFPEEILPSVRIWSFVQFIDTDLLNSGRKYFNRSIFAQLPKVVKKKKFENCILKKPIWPQYHMDKGHPYSDHLYNVQILSLYANKYCCCCHRLKLPPYDIFHESHLKVVTSNWLNLSYLPSFYLAHVGRRK